MDKPKTLLDGFGEATDQVVALRAEVERLRARNKTLEERLDQILILANLE